MNQTDIISIQNSSALQRVELSKSAIWDGLGSMEGIHKLKAVAAYGPPPRKRPFPPNHAHLGLF